MKIVSGILITLLAVSGIIYYIGNYRMIHTDSIISADIDRKEEQEGRYFIFVKNQKVEVQDESLWNVIEEDRSYDIQYESYGEKVPYITEILVHGEGKSINSAH
jgi:hypothetical protein